MIVATHARSARFRIVNRTEPTGGHAGHATAVRVIELPGGAWRLRASQAELAQLAGVTRQTANEWLRASAVAVGYRQLSGAADQVSSRRK